MVRITVDNYRDFDSLVVYELPKGSLVVDLKAEIEATEGHQRLGNRRGDGPDYQDYQDDQNLDSLISGNLCETIIYLRQALIYCHFKLRDITETSDYYLKHQETEIVGISVNLDRPIYTSKLRRDWRYRTALSPELFALDPYGQPTINISDISKPFSYYGIRNGDVITIISLPPPHYYSSLSKRGLLPPIVDEIHKYFPPFPCSNYTPLQTYTIVQAKHNWDGEIMHPHIKGISLKRNALFISEKSSFIGQPGWLYGSPIPSTEVGSPERPYVPALDKKIVFVTIPESEVLNVQVHENELHRKEIHTDKEVTESQSKERHLDGVNIGTHGTTVGFQGGMSGKYSFGSTEKGSKVSQRKVTAGIDKEDTIFWNLKAPSTKLDEDGLNGEEVITLVLKEKPVEFKYNCRITHAKNGVEKTMERRTKNWPRKLF
ncbi:hypothetical protein Clacol_007079 [Clathrus columnatus]|uniref:Uncharacterized protein n=1 Tax=Clathrus columnatus TaxID=1419009 RepID=A0AAV5AJI3_9AGAM|nr:hypothetical protein Clacol_007079 [Clathrus columnatus]